MGVVKKAAQQDKPAKVNRCMYLPRDLLAEGKAVSLKEGVPLSALVAKGLRMALDRWHAFATAGDAKRD
jgi:hypothetical protein